MSDDVYLSKSNPLRSLDQGVDEQLAFEARQRKRGRIAAVLWIVGIALYITLVEIYIP